MKQAHLPTLYAIKHKPPAPPQPRPQDPAVVTTSDGQTLQWRLRFMTDRFGERDVNNEWGCKDLAEWAKTHRATFDKLWSRCLGEMAFVVELNGKRGILYEVEYGTVESEGNGEDGKPCGCIPEAQARAHLKSVLADLEHRHPELPGSWSTCRWSGMAGWVCGDSAHKTS